MQLCLSFMYEIRYISVLCNIFHSNFMPFIPLDFFLSIQCKRVLAYYKHFSPLELYLHIITRNLNFCNLSFYFSGILTAVYYSQQYMERDVKIFWNDWNILNFIARNKLVFYAYCLVVQIVNVNIVRGIFG